MEMTGKESIKLKIEWQKLLILNIRVKTKLNEECLRGLGNINRDLIFMSPQFRAREKGGLEEIMREISPIWPKDGNLQVEEAD